MEINARVYAVASDLDLLEQVHQILEAKTFQASMLPEILEPCAVLPLKQTWYGFRETAEPTDRPGGWLPCLRICAQTLMKNGAVVVEFSSPDHPDGYLEYAFTTPGGEAGKGERVGLIGYDRALGSSELRKAMEEIFSGRSARERQILCRRREREEAARREKGDFEITPGGVLKKYRGHDTDVVVPDGVREIGECAFVDMKGVERLIMEFEHYDAPEMKTLTLPESVVKIGSYAMLSRTV